MDNDDVHWTSMVRDVDSTLRSGDNSTGRDIAMPGAIDDAMAESLGNLVDLHEAGLSVQWPHGYDALSATTALRAWRSRGSQEDQGAGAGDLGSGGFGGDEGARGTSRVARLPTGSQAPPRTFSFLDSQPSSSGGQDDLVGRPTKLRRKTGTTTASEDGAKPHHNISEHIVRNVRPKISAAEPSIDEELALLNRR